MSHTERAPEAVFILRKLAFEEKLRLLMYRDTVSFSQSNVLDRAVDWIFSHLDDLESMDVSEGGRSAAESEGGREPPPGPRVRDGPGSECSKT